jgi:6,7-dimethyl-8-ribityllumazine synthase
MRHTPEIPPPVALVVSRYNASITDALRHGAEEAYAEAGGDPTNLVPVEAPGAFELPALCLAAVMSGRCAGAVAIGCLIRGQTTHADHIAAAVAQGLVGVTLQTGAPVTFGLLTVADADQARARAGGAEGNKGREAMRALLETLAAMDALDGGHARPLGPKPDKAATGTGG